MAAEKFLPVAVIGVGGFGRMTLDALAQSDCVKVVGISDRNARAAEQAGRQLGLPFYTDNRSLLAETRPAAVFIATPPAAAAEIISACAERGIHVWKELPLARGLAEGVELVQRMERAGLKLAVGTQRRFAAGYRRAAETAGEVGEVFLARGHYMFNWRGSLDWRGDSESAGGGALMEVGYHVIDLLGWMLGLPHEIYGLSSPAKKPQLSADDGSPLSVYDTEDTAVAMLGYQRGCMATIVASRSCGPHSEELNIHGRGGSIRATSESCLFRDPGGNIIDHLASDPAPGSVFGRQCEAFAQAVLGGSPRYECSGRENLLNLAVIEAVYLSSRTGAPENPHRLLKANGLTAEDCLTLRPV